jgi:hypothetical protein
MTYDSDPRRAHNPFRPQVPFSMPERPYLERLREELRPLTYSLVGKQTKLLPKKDHSTLLGHSPDVCDAFIMSWAF